VDRYELIVKVESMFQASYCRCHNNLPIPTLVVLMPQLLYSRQVFTVVGFNRYKGHPLSGHGVQEEVPETLAGHVGFWMSYDTMTKPESHTWGYR